MIAASSLLQTLSLNCAAYDHKASFDARHRTLYQEKVAVRIHLDDFQILNGHPFSAHAAGKRAPFKHPGRRNGTQGTHPAVVLGAVAHAPAALIVALDGTLKTLTLAGGCDVYLFPFLENADVHRVTHAQLGKILI